MLTPQIIKTDIKPAVFENLKNGYWYYNYNITSSTEDVTTQDEEGNETTETETKTFYSYVLIKMYGKPTYKKSVEAVIRKFITTSQELDFVNTRNKINLGLLTDETEIAEENEKYEEYLNKVAEIKTNVKRDFGIS